MKQTGYIHEYRETDYQSETTMFGAADVMPSGDWANHLPKGEKQHKDYAFDTMSCTTFSALKDIVIWMNFLDKSGMLSKGQKQALADFYDDNGDFNISDRFTAIMGGTTRQGASFQQIWDSIRKDGILPEKDLPFGGNNWDEYHDKSVITEEMKAKAKSYLKVFIFAYSWARVENLKNELRQSPIQIAIPKPGTHAVVSVADKKIFDSYDPFLKDYTGEIAYALKPWIYVASVKEVLETNKKRDMYKPKNFILDELVSKKIFDEHGERAWQFLDERILKNLQAVRDYYGVSVRVNDWKWGGDFQYSGFDEGGFRKDGTSQHNMGRAVDFSVSGKTAQQVREDLASGKIKLPYPNVWIEKDVDWVHMDCRASDKEGVYQFNA